RLWDSTRVVRSVVDIIFRSLLALVATPLSVCPHHRFSAAQRLSCFSRVMVLASALALLAFFFQAEDGIRDFHVTGVQTCALPICGARTAGNALGGCLGFIGKMIAWLMLIYTGLSILGMFIFYVFNMMNLFGLENPILFPPLQILSPDDAVIALSLGFMAATIPFLALFLWLVRILFKTDKLNNYLSLTMFAVWIVSVVGVIYYCVYAAQDFREKSTINVQKNITPQKVYYFTEKDVRVLDASEKDSLRS